MTGRLDCGTHGKRDARFVCDHLFTNHRLDRPQRLLWFAPACDEGEQPPAIWCEACEGVVTQQGEVNDAVHEFARFHLVCDLCLRKYIDGNQAAHGP
jgi:hypothetical protein